MKKLFLLLMIILLTGCAGDKIMLDTNKGYLVINVEIADDNQERQKGLMNREVLDEYDGMLFVFEKPGNYGFWMKNTLIPLDMIFIDEDKNIVNIHKNVPPCKEDPCPSYAPEGKILYVLEVNGGFVDENKVKEKSKVKFIS